MVPIPRTLHATVRQQQRGMTDEILAFVLDFGDVHYGRGVAWYTVRERSLPSYLRGSQLAERARSWVVLAWTGEGSTETICTMYRTRNASRHVRRKTSCPHRRGGPVNRRRRAWRVG
jgi:hypothetical protein